MKTTLHRDGKDRSLTKAIGQLGTVFVALTIGTALQLVFCQAAIAGTADAPVRPTKGNVTFEYNKSAAWASKPHNGTDYSSALNATIVSVGKGIIYGYTKPNASRFGSVNPDGAGPAIWITHKLSDGSPIYVLYGHTATTWNDKSSYDKNKKKFTFDCTYSITLKSGSSVKPGERIGYTAPFYNNGVQATHVHISVFKPHYDGKNKTYYAPPSSGWGYSDVKVDTGEYVDPGVFFKKFKLNNN